MRALALLTPAPVLLVGCGDAALTVQGGEYVYEGGPPSTISTGDDGGGSDGPGSMLPAGCQVGGANGGSGWSDLYLCFFGPSGVANCSVTAACHGPGGSAGFWTCGAGKDACYQGIQAVINGVTDPTSCLLYQQLRKPDGSGFMPLSGLTPTSPPYTFSDSDLMRIATWLQGGAPNN
ncbi:MAG TPA: hypothetical protein VE987_05475 [Polyangiaceae bacterium]|nr:hypothetical protein [Polyangiaceae bacterium]